MELSFTQPLIEPTAAVLAQAGAWEDAQVPIYVLLALACISACIWSIRSHARDRRAAVTQAEARDRRLNELTSASDERIRRLLMHELELTRSAHDRDISEQLGRFIREVNAGLGRLEQQLTSVEVQLKGGQERTSLLFNEAMVVIQQAGSAAARMEARYHRGQWPAS